MRNHGMYSNLRVLAVLAISLAAVSAAAEAPATAPLTMRLSLKNSTGQVVCGVWGSDKGFPTEPSTAMQTKSCAINNAESACTFDPLRAGTYAVVCFHDENKNGKLDLGTFGRPLEGTAASNNAKGFMGPPSFKDARFSFNGSAGEQRLKVNY